MLSVFRVATYRVAVKAYKQSFSSSSILSNNIRMRSIQKPTIYSFQHFSTAPPLFLDATEVTERIMTVVKNFDQIDASKVTAETNFATDLGLDSLDIVEVVMAIEDEFAIEIPDQEADKIQSIAEAVAYISTHPMAK